MVFFMFLSSRASGSEGLALRLDEPGAVQGAMAVLIGAIFQC